MMCVVKQVQVGPFDHKGSKGSGERIKLRERTLDHQEMEIAEVDQFLSAWPAVHAQYRSAVTK
jgi:hypothetical protein